MIIHHVPVHVHDSEDHAVKLGIGGFSMGRAAALHLAACYAHGKFSSGMPVSPTLSSPVQSSPEWVACSLKVVQLDLPLSAESQLPKQQALLVLLIFF
jgi:S-formylglutathione hydrolase FrmB